MILDIGHSAYQLSQAKVWSRFTMPDPMGLRKISHLNDLYVLTSHDSDRACQTIKINAKDGFYDRVTLDTENHTVLTAIMLNGGIQGQSMKLDGSYQPLVNDIILLGCNRSILLKYERLAGDETAVWVKTGECTLNQNITDILQIHPLTVLCVQEEGCFDVVDVTSMHGVGHTPQLQGLSKSYKTRLVQRSAEIAIADENGFFFAKMVTADNHTNVIKMNEQYAQN